MDDEGVFLAEEELMAVSPLQNNPEEWLDQLVESVGDDNVNEEAGNATEDIEDPEREAVTPEPHVISHKKAICNVLELEKYYLYNGMHDIAAR